MADEVKADRVTIRTVAVDAGVSVSAVSKVLRNAYGVSEELRARVNTSIARLGYRPSMAARSMRGRTRTVGILLVEMDNPFLPDVVRGISEGLCAEGYTSLMAVGQADLAIETSLIDSMLDFRMNGIILVAPRLKGAQLDAYAQQIPMAVIGHHEPGATSFDTVNGDDAAAVMQIVQWLHASGRRRIHMASLSRTLSESDVSYRREIAYRAAMTALGLEAEIAIHRVEETREGRSRDAAALLDLPDQPEAYFCWSDLVAVELVSQARARGIRLPGDLAIVGIDDSSVAALPQIDLASFNQDGSGLGAAAARCLLSRIDGRREAKHLLLPGHLVERSSLA